MIKCKICNKEFKNELGARGHSRIHSPKEKKRIELKTSQYKNITDEIFIKFLDNKYTKWYYSIISQARKKNYSGYTEKHHVIPRSLGGGNGNNIVKLSAKEHYMCHLLLTKMINEKTKFYYKMILAFNMMSTKSNNQDRNYINLKKYEKIKNDLSIAKSISQTGSKNSQYGKIWISHLDMEISKKILPNELDTYIKKGWIKKRIYDFKTYKEKNTKTIKLSHENCNNFTDFYNLDLNNKKIHECYIKGLSTREIAKIVNMSHVTISNKIKVIKKL